MLASVNALPFDTHRVVKRLTEAGFSEPQAETVTDVLREARVSELSDLVTKADLTSEIGKLRNEMNSEIGKLRNEMHVEFGLVRAEIAKGQTDTIKWMFGMLLVQGGFIIGLIRLLPGH